MLIVNLIGYGTSYIILFTVIAPRFVIQPTDTSAAEPFSGVFTCSAKRRSDLNIIWHRHINPLPHKAYSMIIASENKITSILTIPNVAIEDVGKYYCVVQASIITIQSKFANLYFSGKTCRYSYTYCTGT